MKKTKLLASLSILLLLSTISYAQTSLVVNLPDTTAQTGDTLLINLTTRQFSKIVSMQFSINWDATVIQYVAVQPDDLPFIAIGSADAANGNLRVSWFDIEGKGQTLPDGSALIQLKFFVNGSDGDYTDLSISDTPVDIQIFKATDVPDSFEEIALQQEAGSVTVGTGFLVNFNLTDVACFGGNTGAIATAIANAPPGAVIAWRGPNGFTSQNEDLSDLAAGNYTLKITNGSETLLDTTLVLAQPSTALVIDTIAKTNTGCAQATGAAIATVQGGEMPYSFSIGGNFGSSNQFNNLAAGNYVLRVRDAANCEVMDTFEILAADAPQISLEDTLFICQGESLLLDAGAFSTYAWSTGAATRSITVSTTGIYRVTVTDAQDCSAADTVVILSGVDFQLIIENETLGFCPGEAIQLLVSGAETYEWIDTSNTLNDLTIPNPTARPRATTSYTVIGSTACGVDSMQVSVFQFNSEATAGPDTCIIPGVELQLYASGGVAYFWFLSEYPVSDSRIPNPVTQPEDSTAYFVMITDANGCEKLDTLIVTVGGNPLDIEAPNLITPNGDGKNDELKFGDLTKYGVNSLRVYNRWGQLLYEKINYQSDEDRFDGTHKGKPLPAGNYYYVLSFRNGEVKQTLTILRE